MDNLLQIKSIIDPSFEIIILTEEDELYQKFKNDFLKDWNAYHIHNTKTILINGTTLDEIDYPIYDLIQFFIAHEIAHYRLKHKPIQDPQQELDADLLAIKLCTENNLLKSAEIGKSEFKFRHGISYEEALFIHLQ